MARVFICYSRKDSAFVARLTADLRDAGVPVWRDEDDIPGDELASRATWRRAVDRALAECSQMVVVLSPDAVESEEVEAEWNHFVNADKPVYPVKCSECRVPYRLDALNWWDLREDYARHVERLAALLRGDVRAISGSVRSPVPGGTPARLVAQHRDDQAQIAASRTRARGEAVVESPERSSAEHRASAPREQREPPETDVRIPGGQVPDALTSELQRRGRSSPIRGAVVIGAAIVVITATWLVSTKLGGTPATVNSPPVAPTSVSFRTQPPPTPGSPSQGAETATEAPSPDTLRPGVGLRRDGPPEIEWVDVPAGAFTMGSDEPEDANPLREVTLPAFSISKYEATYAQYRAFLDAPDGYKNETWWNEPVKLYKRQADPGQQKWAEDDRPAENVSWYDAMGYCRWLTARLRAAGELGANEEIRLPTEEEWEKAARGTSGREYPWGDEFESRRANTNAGGPGETTPVGSYPAGASPYGVLDMSGNVWEWTLTEYESKTNNDVTNSARVLRGGSWYFAPHYARAAYSGWGNPNDRDGSIGFRVVLAAPVH